MFSSKSSAAAYQSVGIESRVAGSNAHELVTLLFDGFLERVQLAKLAIAQGDLGLKVRHINKAIEILSEGLRAHLDTEAGGELAQNLDALYHYCSFRLIDANVRNDTGPLTEVQGLIEPVASAWKQNWVGTGGGRQFLPGSVAGGSSKVQKKMFAGLTAYGSGAALAGA